jgi:hypothetical protein
MPSSALPQIRRPFVRNDPKMPPASPSARAEVAHTCAQQYMRCAWAPLIHRYHIVRCHRREMPHRLLSAEARDRHVARDRTLSDPCHGLTCSDANPLATPPPWVAAPVVKADYALHTHSHNGGLESATIALVGLRSRVRSSRMPGLLRKGRPFALYIARGRYTMGQFCHRVAPIVSPAGSDGPRRCKSCIE